MAAPDDLSQQEKLAQARFEQEQVEKLFDAYTRSMKEHEKAVQDYINASDAIVSAREEGLEEKPYSDAGVQAAEALRDAKKSMEQAERDYDAGRDNAKKLLDNLVLDREQSNKDQIEEAQLIANQAEKAYQAALSAHSQAIEAHDKAIGEYNNVKERLAEAREQNSETMPLEEEEQKAAQALRAAAKVSDDTDKAMQSAEQDYAEAAEQLNSAIDQRKQVLEKRLEQEPQALPLPDFKKPSIEPVVPTSPDLDIKPNAEMKTHASLEEGVYKKAFGKEMLEVKVGPKDENGQHGIYLKFDNSLGRPSRNVALAKLALGLHEGQEIEIKNLRNPKHLEHIVNAAKEMKEEGLLKKPIKADKLLEKIADPELRRGLKKMVDSYNEKLDPSEELEKRAGPSLS